MNAANNAVFSRALGIFADKGVPHRPRLLF